VLLSKLRETLICLKAGRVTLGYPFVPMEPKPGFAARSPWIGSVLRLRRLRERLPGRVIVVSDTEQHTRLLEFFWRRCTYCGRCEEVCRRKRSG
jgi:hydrogenase-4 component H